MLWGEQVAGVGRVESPPVLVGRDLFSALIIWGRSSSSFRFWVTEILCLLTDVLVPFKNILKIA